MTVTSNSKFFFLCTLISHLNTLDNNLYPFSLQSSLAIDNDSTTNTDVATGMVRHIGEKSDVKGGLARLFREYSPLDAEEPSCPE